ncbi:MAG: DUF2934 domain-containing protein [Nitrospira sp.]|nr:DUF2934 domain-containing protein [Nitrospira sp.]
MSRSTSKAKYKNTNAVEENGSEHFDASREVSDSTNGNGLESDLRMRIAERAFLLYEERGFRHGNDLEHWFEAERQVKTLGV